MGPALNNSKWALSDVWHDCTLRIDDVEGFQHSTLQAYVSRIVRPLDWVTIYFDISLVRVDVIYEGGPLIPVSRITFYDCKFNFDVPSRPLGDGQKLVQGLLLTGLENSAPRVTVRDTEPTSN
jgi:hypothetical protein